jgi:microcystin-dependent protein
MASYHTIELRGSERFSRGRAVEGAGILLRAMSEPFLAEIRIVSFAFAPKGWAMCNGQLLPINQNQALFSLLGTTYGGDGRVNFALPDLRGRTPLHFGTETLLGERAGAEVAALVASQLPVHTHGALADAGVATSSLPAAALLAKKPRFGASIYAAPQSLVELRGDAVAPTGGGQPHENMQPFLTLNFVIALQGIFPSRN